MVTLNNYGITDRLKKFTEDVVFVQANNVGYMEVYNKKYPIKYVCISALATNEQACNQIRKVFSGKNVDKYLKHFKISSEIVDYVDSLSIERQLLFKKCVAIFEENKSSNDFSDMISIIKYFNKRLFNQVKSSSTFSYDNFLSMFLKATNQKSGELINGAELTSYFHVFLILSQIEHRYIEFDDCAYEMIKKSNELLNESTLVNDWIVNLKIDEFNEKKKTYERYFFQRGLVDNKITLADIYRCAAIAEDKGNHLTHQSISKSEAFLYSFIVKNFDTLNIVDEKIPKEDIYKALFMIDTKFKKTKKDFISEILEDESKFWSSIINIVTDMSMVQIYQDAKDDLFRE